MNEALYAIIAGLLTVVFTKLIEHLFNRRKDKFEENYKLETKEFDEEFRLRQELREELERVTKERNYYQDLYNKSKQQYYKLFLLYVELKIAYKHVGEKKDGIDTPIH